MERPGGVAGAYSQAGGGSGGQGADIGGECAGAGKDIEMPGVADFLP